VQVTRTHISRCTASCLEQALKTIKSHVNSMQIRSNVDALTLLENLNL
jgi:hypothetical protein